MISIDPDKRTVYLLPGWLCEPGTDGDVVSANFRRRVVRLPAGWVALVDGRLVWPPGLESA